MNKPIDPTTHAAMDYGLAAMHLVGPACLGLDRRATAISELFGMVYGATAALTDTPLGFKRVIPFPLHGMLEGPSIAAIALVPWVAGALKSSKAQAFFLGSAGIALANFMLTDFNAQQETEERYPMGDVRAAAPESLEPLLRT